MRVEVPAGGNLTEAWRAARHRDGGDGGDGAGLDLILGPGVHRIDEELVWHPTDGALTITGEPGATQLCGGRVLPEPEIDTDGCWEWPFDVLDRRPRQLHVAGRRARRARLPRPSLKLDATGFTMSRTSEPAIDWTGSELVMRHMWLEQRIRVTGQDGDRLLVSPDAWTRLTCADFMTPPEVTWAEDVAGADPAPGEWTYAARTGRLRYRPRPGENPGEEQVIVPGAHRILMVDGTTDRFQNAPGSADVVISGVTFCHSDPFDFEAEGGLVAIQASQRSRHRPSGPYVADPDAERPPFYTRRTDYDEVWLDTTPLPAAVELRGTRALVSRCTFTGMGADALAVDIGTVAAEVARCTFDDIGGSGLRVGDPADHHPEPGNRTSQVTVHDSGFSRCGALYAGSPALLTGYVDHCTVEHCSFEDLPYSAISAGWGWGLVDVPDVPTPMREVKIVANSFNSVMQELDDGGAIYTLGAAPDSEIAGNVIRRFRARYGGVYLDQGSSGYAIRNNIAVDCDGRAWILHLASENTVVGNQWDDGAVDAGEHGAWDNRVSDNRTIRSASELDPAALAEAGIRPARRSTYPHSWPASPHHPDVVLADEARAVGDRAAARIREELSAAAESLPTLQLSPCELLERALGVPSLTVREVRVTGTESRSWGASESRLYDLGDGHLEGLLLRPDAALGARLAIVFHGGMGTPELVCTGRSDNYRGMVPELIRAGYHVWLPRLCMPSADRSSHDERAAIDDTLRQRGSSLLGWELAACRAVTTALSTELHGTELAGPTVATGLSIGAQYSMLFAALTPGVDRVLASCPPAAEWLCHSSYTWRMVGRALAPRPLLLHMGSEDEIFDAADTRRAAHVLGDVYAAAHARGAFNYIETPTGHEYLHEITDRWLEESAPGARSSSQSEV